MEFNSYKSFMKLGAFGKYDFKRFAGDIQRLQVNTRPQDKLTQNPVPKDNGSQSNGSQDNGKGSKKKRKVKFTAAKKAQLQEEEVNRIRNKNHIHVNGTDIPPPLVSFQDLSDVYHLREVVLQNIKAQDYDEPTGIQRQAVPIMLQGRDIMACAPTGSGKTAAFILPVLHHVTNSREEDSVDKGKKGSKNEKGKTHYSNDQTESFLGPKALILSPTRELAKQTQREFRKLSKGLGIRTAFIENINTIVKKSQQEFDILVTTPNRLVYMLQHEPPLLTVNGVVWLVVDESDKLFEAGKRGFRDQLGAIYRACSNPGLHRAMFSATFAQDVEEWCKLNLDNVVQVHIGAKNTATNSVHQELIFTGDESGKLIAFRNLVKEGMQPPVLMFVQSKERAKNLHTELMYDDILVDVIHADRPQDQRDEVVKKFRLGKIWVLISTELMSRGIDFKGVNLVVNYDFPTSAISYIHRIGRTGRAGRKGRAVTFFTENDKPNLRSIANMIRQAGCPVPDYMVAMKKASRRQRRSLVDHVPERGSILTMDPREYERLKLKRKINHKSHSSKKVKRA